jgi:hypothetical protein
MKSKNEIIVMAFNGPTPVSIRAASNHQLSITKIAIIKKKIKIGTKNTTTKSKDKSINFHINLKFKKS